MEGKHDLFVESIQQFIEENALEEDAHEMLTVMEYVEQNRMRDEVAHQNFLSKKQVLELKNEMNKKSEFIFKLKGKNYELWKPAKMKLSKHMKEVLEKTT